MAPKVSLQTFTIRRYLTSPTSIEKAFARIKEIGLNAVELAYIRFKPHEIEAVAKACQHFNIEVGSTQITFDYLQKNKNWVLDFHQHKLGCKFTSVSVLPHRAIVGDQSKLLHFAEELDQLGAYYRERGLQLCFHHHDFEFRRYGDRLGLELLLENTDKNNVGLVLDTYWTQRGGKSAQDLIRDLDGRVKVVHLRDYRIRRKYFELLPTDAELGQGNLDFKRIINSCCATGVQYMAIEQTSKHPFESVKTSVTHLHTLGFGNLF